MEATKSSRLQNSITEMAVRAQERRARRLLIQGNLDTAMVVYREILELNPDYANAHFQLGLCYRQRRQWSEAAEALQRAHILGDARAEALLAELRSTVPGAVPAGNPALASAAHPDAAYTDADYTDAAYTNVDDDAEDEISPAVIVGGQVITQAPPEPHPQGPQIYPDAISARRDPQTVTEPQSVYAGRSQPVRAEEEADEVLYRPILCPPVDEVFALGGKLANSLGARYRPRAGQVRMANLIREALQGRRHAVIEAGTGIGKSFAYLIPVLWSGAPAVVSTSNKALMNQLWDKDIPRLREIAPRPVKAALLKGRANYVCRLRWDRLRQQVGRPGQAEDMALIREGLERVPEGDLERMGLPASLAAQLRVSNRECKGYHCPDFESCFYEKAKREALEADVVVTNHAMLCYNTLIAENHILPVRPVLIIDEAHQLTRYAIEALTLALEDEQFWSLINGSTVRGAVDDPGQFVEVKSAYDDFFRDAARLRPGAARSGHRPGRWALTGEIQTALALRESLRHLQSTVSHAQGLDEAEQESALLQLEELAQTTDALARPEPETHIRICEVAETSSQADVEALLASYRPLEVGSTLRRLLFDAWPRVICTSATLSVANDLGWYRRQVGLFESPGADGTQVISEMLDSPFDYPRQVLLYTPRSLVPVYNEQRQAFTKDYVQQLTDEVARLLEASGGRALVLCTSRARMHQLYDALAMGLRDRYPCYLQGELAQPELVRRFKEDGNAILFATRGFWEGLDIPGDALALVILDKIPFVPYDDPVIRKQEAQIRARGGNPFYDLQLGSAILNLRQGAGRLIRSETDRGVIALLDTRVLQKSYGRQIIHSLPEGCHTTNFDDVVAFLRRK